MNNCSITPTLLISRINGIPVRQVGESSLQASNNHVNDHKIGLSFMGNGENRTIDLGKGEKKYSIQVETNNYVDTKLLLDVCENKRYCTIVDKWKGWLTTHYKRPFKILIEIIKKYGINFYKLKGIHKRSEKEKLLLLYGHYLLAGAYFSYLSEYFVPYYTPLKGKKINKKRLSF